MAVNNVAAFGEILLTLLVLLPGCTASKLVLCIASYTHSNEIGYDTDVL